MACWLMASMATLQRRRRFMQRRHLVLAALASLMASIGTNALAQGNYPERPIKLVVPYAPGGSADIAARLIADEWAKQLGSSLFIENRGGAGGNLGVDLVAKAAGDGYTPMYSALI
eukprot:Opistho-1_new@32103